MRSANRYDNVKRAIDLVAASALYVLTLPLQAVIAILIRKKLGPPVLFRQKRPGLDGKVFELMKFRTLRDARKSEGPESDGDRLISFGQRLRSLSLDELPTLLNVIRGDMSLVGPRPLLVEYLGRYTLEQPSCAGVQPLALPEVVDGSELTASGCFPTSAAPDSLAGNIAVSEGDGTVWLWAGDSLVRSGDGGATWQ